ncbi:MAG: DUF4167 domain-containing protein [Alphaproteobacteria bacterium]
MRQGQNPKRSRGRSGGGRRNVSPRHQNFDSNGPSIRIRGNAHQVYEKYLQLARDAYTAGDRIAAENMYQHAEHYFRLVNMEDAENGQPRQNRGDSNDSRSSDRQYSGNDQRDNDDSSDSNEETAHEAPSPRQSRDTGRGNDQSPGTSETDDDTKTARRPARKPRRNTARPVEADKNGNVADLSGQAAVVVEKPHAAFDPATAGDEAIDERAAD